MREPDEESAADRDAGAADPGEEGGGLCGPDSDRLPEAESREPLLGLSGRVGLRASLELPGSCLGTRGAAAQVFGREQDKAVDGKEGRGRGGAREEGAELVLEEETDQSRRNRADDQQPRKPCVGVVVPDLAISQAAAESFENAHPFGEEEEEKDERRREVRGDEKGEEVGLVLAEIPAEELREDNRMSEARDREQLRHALQETDHD